MTQWAYVRYPDWSPHDEGYEELTTRVCEFLGADGPVEVFRPTTKIQDACNEVLSRVKPRIALVSGTQPVRLFVHPEDKQLKKITEADFSTTTHALVVLWNRHRAFEGWAIARGAINLADPSQEVEPHPVLVEALEGVPTNNGLAGGYGRDRLVESLQALNRAGYVINGPDLEVAGGLADMELDDLQNLRKFADEIAQGKNLRVSNKMLRSDVVKVWEQAVQEEATGR